MGTPLDKSYALFIIGVFNAKFDQIAPVETLPPNYDFIIANFNPKFISQMHKLAL
jgi:hypothetical protein